MSTFSKNSFLKLILIPLFVLGLGLAYGQTPSVPLTGGGGGGGGKINLVGGFSTNFLTPSSPTAKDVNLYMLALPPSATDNLIQSLFFSEYLKSQSALAGEPQISPTTRDIETFLSATQSNVSKLQSQAIAQYLPLPGLTDIYGYVKGKLISAKASSASNNLSALNVESLLGPVQYDTTKYNTASKAADFIKYVASLYNPTTTIDFSQLSSTELKQAVAMSTVQQYLILTRSMAANLSVGLNNLYYLFDQRVPEKTTKLLGSSATPIELEKLPSNLQKDASPLALQKWMATRRLTSDSPSESNTSWAAGIQKANPATLQREMVYLLAEIRYELFQNRMVMERLLATQSVEQLQTGATQQFQLNSLQRSICGNSLFSNACPPTTTPANSAAVVVGGTPSTTTTTTSD